MNDPLLLVTGARGQVGREITAIAPAWGWRVASLGREALNICHEESVTEALYEIQPALVINAAAYTAVDRAESEPDAAMAINGVAPGYLARTCAMIGVPLIHLSTDYVFGGHGTRPWQETDEVAPLGVYGQSKWMGEEAIRHRLAEHLIVRTSWVFGVHGDNFVKSMLRLGQRQSTMRVVDDQIGCPTGAVDLARFLLDLSMRIRENNPNFPWGTYHYAGQPPVSRYEFARTIFQLCDPGLLPHLPEVHPVSSNEYPTVARRPNNSVLDCRLVRERFKIEPHDWVTSLKQVLAWSVMHEGSCD